MLAVSQDHSCTPRAARNLVTGLGRQPDVMISKGSGNPLFSSKVFTKSIRTTICSIHCGQSIPCAALLAALLSNLLIAPQNMRRSSAVMRLSAGSCWFQRIPGALARFRANPRNSCGHNKVLRVIS